MLSKAVETETNAHNNNGDNDSTRKPYYFLFRLTNLGGVGVLPHLLSYLLPTEQNNLIAAMNGDLYSFFKPAREQYYLPLTRQQRAILLRNHVMNWRYDEIAKLVEMDPLVLGVICDYKMNRWQEDSASRSLSAIEYAWLAGDENFIELFERLGEGRLPEWCYQNREALQAESRTILTKLATAFTALDDDVISHATFEELLCEAPHWVYGLTYCFCKDGIDTAAKAQEFDVFSPSYRLATQADVSATKNNPVYFLSGMIAGRKESYGWFPCVVVRLSETTHPQPASRAETNVIEPPQCRQM